MCELFAVNAGRPVVVNDYLTEFFDHSHIHRDGWGISWRRDDAAAGGDPVFLHREPVPAYESDYIYLLGDIVDFWAMNRSIQWTRAHNTVVQKVLRKARHGTQVIFIPGNHDEVLREYAIVHVLLVDREQYTTLGTAVG